MPELLLTSPHSGEKIASETPWLDGLAVPVLFRDADRFVDRLYQPVADTYNLPYIKAEWHRYVADLNRMPEDVDAGSVEGAESAPGTHPKGFHWQVTTHNEPLMQGAISKELHQSIREKYYDPFHRQVGEFLAEHAKSGAVYHVDCHSMPSQGTQFHPDPGKKRAEIVLGDQFGKSCSSQFRDLVIKAYEGAGFEVVMNDPYKGGRITERYGQPAVGQHTIQVEMNRELYMDEETKELIPEKAERVQSQLVETFKVIVAGLATLGDS